jgi:sphingomyelin phosphodiesterase acid-like 3
LRSIRPLSKLQVASLLLLPFLASSLLASRAEGQSFSSEPSGHGAADSTIPALLVSDIHFDPFHDPAKAQQLGHAPVRQWSSILSAAPSPNQQQAFAELQQSCPVRGVDTPYALLRSSLQAMRSSQPSAKFITVSGDLIAHSFSCKYTKLFPGSTSGEYQEYVEKTISFVVEQLRTAFPSVPVYVALGNNDSGCSDYQLDASSEFLVHTGQIVAEGVPAADRQRVIEEFATGGYYSLTMAAPMRDTRLIVINDLFLSPRYSTCAGKPDPAPAAAQIAWIREQLKQARQMHQRVWVMGHIPPGVDPYSTVAKFKDVCGSEGPAMFLSDDRLADLLIEYADVVRLTIFAHTHMDEIRLLEPEGADSHGLPERGVAVKLVPSISPVDGNNPSFTVASVNPSTAVLQNYEVIAASNQTGIATTWSKEYDYAQTYQESEFSPAALKRLISEFKEDRRAQTDASEEYIRNYFAGNSVPEIKPFWPQYVCSLANPTAKGYAACVCSAK